jgi:hypothetical protein
VRYGSGAVNWTAGLTSELGASDTVTGLSSSTTCEFYVVAFNTGGESTSSNTISVSTLLPPSAPSGLTVAPVDKSSTSLRLAWTDNSTKETGFKVQRTTDGVHFTEVASLNVDVQSWDDTNRNPCTVMITGFLPIMPGNSGYQPVRHSRTAPPTNVVASFGEQLLECSEMGQHVVRCPVRVYE